MHAFATFRAAWSSAAEARRLAPPLHVACCASHPAWRMLRVASCKLQVRFCKMRVASCRDPRPPQARPAAVDFFRELMRSSRSDDAPDSAWARFTEAQRRRGALISECAALVVAEGAVRPCRSKGLRHRECPVCGTNVCASCARKVAPPRQERRVHMRIPHETCCSRSVRPPFARALACTRAWLRARVCATCACAQVTLVIGGAPADARRQARAPLVSSAWCRQCAALAERYPARHDIDAAWHPTQHGIPRGMASRTAR